MKEAEQIIDFCNQMIAAIENEQETPERLDERIEWMEMRDELLAELRGGK